MDLIESRNFTDPELAALESQAIDVAQNNTDALLDAYALANHVNGLLLMLLGFTFTRLLSVWRWFVVPQGLRPGR